MRMKKIKNISNTDVVLDLGEGTTVNLPPGQEIGNVRVNNLDMIRDRCNVVSDLGEVNEHRSGKTRLNG